MLPNAQTCFQRTQFLCQSHYCWVKWWWTQIWCLVNVFCWLQNRSLGDLVILRCIWRCILKHNSACSVATLLTFGCQLVQVLGVVLHWSDSEYQFHIVAPYIYLVICLLSIFEKPSSFVLTFSPVCSCENLLFSSWGKGSTRQDNGLCVRLTINKRPGLACYLHPIHGLGTAFISARKV